MLVPPVAKPRSASRPAAAPARRAATQGLPVSNQAVRLSAPRGVIQPKLAVGAVDDPLEHEADRVADQVMRMPIAQAALALAPPQISRKCAACDQEERLQREPAAQHAVGETPASVHRALAAPGQPLDAATRSYFEPRFGHDLGRVRVHADAAAAASARDVDARAYAVGHHVVFAEGRYAPRTAAGARLLAHELVHTLQQADAPNAVTRTLRRQPTGLTPRTSPRMARLTGSDRLDGFALNRAALTEDHKGRLRILAYTLKSLLAEYPGGSVQITGHTDASGDEAHNEGLGQRRADAASDFLLEAGVPAGAMVTLSAGESALAVPTQQPDPRNRRVEVRFETAPRGFPPGEAPGPTDIPTPEDICVKNPDLAICQTGPGPSSLGGPEPPAPCRSTNCSAVSVDPFDRQPPDLTATLGASFADPVDWFERQLDPERRSALTSIFNRLCGYGIWCQVRSVIKIAAGERPVLLADRVFNVPGLTPSVYFTSASGDALIAALMATGRFCMAYGIGASQHPGQTTLREISGSDSLHISVGPGDQFDAHIDKFSPVTEHPGGSFCSNAPSGSNLGHILRELGPEWLRGKIGLPGGQGFPDFSPGSLVERSLPPAGRDEAPPPLAGVTVRGPSPKPKAPLVPAEVKRGRFGVLSADVADAIQAALDEQVSHEALLPSEARIRLTQARRDVETAGPGEEEARIAARDAVERAYEYADAHEVAFDLADRMDRARRAKQSWVKIDLHRFGNYGLVDGNERRAIVGEIRRIAMILRKHLPEGGAGVNTIVLIFSSKELVFGSTEPAVREEIRLPGWTPAPKGLFD